MKDEINEFINTRNEIFKEFDKKDKALNIALEAFKELMFYKKINHNVIDDYNSIIVKAKENIANILNENKEKEETNE